MAARAADRVVRHICNEWKGKVKDNEIHRVMLRYDIAAEFADLPDAQAVRELVKALEEVAQMPPHSVLAEAAYTGGDLPKKWIKERPIFSDGYNEALREVKLKVETALRNVKP